MAKSKISLADLLVNSLSLVFIFAGFVLAMPSIGTLKRVYESPAWPSVKGQVISSVAESRDEQSYHAKIWFGYEVDGKKLLSDRLSFEVPLSADQRTIERLVASNEPGKPVDVYYDPRDPSFGVLDRKGLPWQDCAMAGIGTMFMLSGGLSFIGMFFRGKEK